MRESGKRSRHGRDNRDNRDNRDDRERDKNQRRRTDRDRDRDEKGSEVLVVYRILCPHNVIGSVIGKNGKVINSIRQDTGAKVKVVDPFPGARDRVITIYCHVRQRDDLEIGDEFDDDEPLCSAQDALLKVHAAVANAVPTGGERDKDREECRLLVPSSQSANIIGKSGATIKKLRSRTRTNIKVTAKDASDPSHSCALEFDNFLLISGDSEAVKRTLFAVSALMYKFPAKENIPLDTSIPTPAPRIIIPGDVPIYHTSGLYPNADSIIPRPMSSILGDFPPYADAGRTWPVYSSNLPMVSGYGGGSRSEELTVKVLCPSNRIGYVIGKGGSAIKSIRQESGARVEVEDRKSNLSECIVNVTSMEALDDLKSMAVEAVLLLQEKISDEDEDIVNLRLLVPSKVIGCIIGKSGCIINEIRKRSKADIKISKNDKPKCAGENDELVEIFGQVGNLRDAIIQIVLRLREDALKDRESGHNNSSAGADGFYSGASSLQMPPVAPHVSSTATLGYEQRAESRSGAGVLSSRDFGYERSPMNDNGYGSLPSHSSSLYSRLPPPSAMEMVIPSYAVGKVMGKGGTNIDNIRKISGADIEISDSKSSRGDRVAFISGTSEQKRAAENLFQAFIMAT